MKTYKSKMYRNENTITLALTVTGSTNYKGLYHNIEACAAGEKTTTDFIRNNKLKSTLRNTATP